ncbi:MAG: 50S ribosomal protein LX [Thermoprotei archaeon]|nr:MAG: 50S ribosomal protein LX [Thermoprotei archaeon]RLF24537.1 MAG: 50S ribosomal protein LX [Thermoprotei archaeon]
MSEVRNFRVEGRMRIGDSWQKFAIEIRAIKPEHAIEKVYSELGSRHKLKRHHIKIERVVEVSPEELRNPYIKAFAEWRP